jgi:amino acid transporter
MEQTSTADPAIAPGLRPNILSPTETLAQSISTIAPMTTPAMTIPLVFALAGNGAWLSYLCATSAILLIALCIGRFARTSSSSGSLYSYATSSLPPLASGVAGWALLLAYIATGASVAGGFINYANVLLLQMTGHQASTVMWAVLCVAVSTYIAYRDVQVSARLMLWIEAVSVLAIVVILVLLVWKTGLHLDHSQLSLTGVKPSSVRLGVVLAIFSFVGFESATAMGEEARNPLVTIPRAVVQSALFCGLFFVVCVYLETLGMARAHANLGESTAPFHVLAKLVGASPFGAIIDVGALVSMFACTLGCITAAARVLLRMAANGIAPAALARTHTKNATPHVAVLVVGVVTGLAVGVLAARGISGLDIYGWLGALAVYGFLTTYGLAAIALPFYLKGAGALSKGALTVSIGAVAAILVALAGTLYPVPTERPYNWLPYFYLGYILLGVCWQMWATRSSVQAVV